MKTKICPKCNSTITVPNFNRHINACGGVGTWEDKQNLIKEETQRIKKNGLRCPHCDRVLYSKAGLSGHIFRSHTEEGIALQKIASERSAEMINTGLRIAPKGKPLTADHKEKLSKAMEGRRFNIQYSKREFYNGVWLDSTYESILARDLDANDVVWNRPKPLIYIDDKGQKRRYFPDFYLPEHNLYLDPKNDYLIKKDKRKIELVRCQNNVVILLLNKNELVWEIIRKIDF